MGALKISSVETLAVDLIKDFEITNDNLRALQVLTAVSEFKNENTRGNLTNAITFIEGSKTKNLAQVRLGQTISFVEKKSMVELISDVFDKIQAISPVLEGDYRKSHSIMYNAAGGLSGVVNNPDQIPDGVEEVIIFSASPYARKIEAGILRRKKGRLQYALRKKKGQYRIALKKRGFSDQAPDGVYKVISKIFRKAYPDYRYSIKEAWGNYGPSGRYPGVRISIRDQGKL